MTVDELIKSLEALNIDHQEVRVEMEVVAAPGSRIREKVTGFHFAASGTMLVLTSDTPF